MDLMSSPSDALDLRRELRKMTQERDAAIQAHKEEVRQGLALFSLLPRSEFYFRKQSQCAFQVARLHMEIAEMEAAGSDFEHDAEQAELNGSYNSRLRTLLNESGA